MKMHRYVIVLVVFLATILLSGSIEYPAYKIRGTLMDAQTNEESQTQKTLEQKYSLKGLKEVVVDVWGGFIQGRRFVILLENDALGRHVRRQVEPRLVQNGLSVLPNQDIQDTRPRFIVDINTIEQPNGKPIVSVKTQLMQEVMLKRDTNIRCFAITWRLTSTEHQGTDDLQGGVSAIVKDHLDFFIKDYLNMNPKQPPKDK